MYNMHLFLVVLLTMGTAVVLSTSFCSGLILEHVKHLSQKDRRELKLMYRLSTAGGVVLAFLTAVIFFAHF
jgi:hypothetical protein